MNCQSKRENLSNKEESNVYSYHLTLFTDADEMLELWLPKTPEGFFKFSTYSQYDFLSIVAKNNHWYALCREPAFFKEVPIADSCEILLSDGALLKISNDEKEYWLLVEKVIPARNIFHNYNIRSDVTIKIGCQPDCDIFYRGPFVSRNHAVLSRSNGIWRIRCFNELYGMYINGKKMTESILNLGDVIYMMSLKIIIGKDFFSVNSGLGSVEVNSAILQNENFHRTSYYHYHDEVSAENTEKYFNPAPRKRREIEEKIITVEGPPMSMSQKQIPLMLRMGSSVLMGGAAALAGNFMTLITSVLFPFLSSKYTDNQRNEYEKLRTTKYNEYLQKKYKEIEAAILYEQDTLNQKLPCVADATKQDFLMNHLWERRPCDSDFLQLRVGTGNRPLSAKIDYPNKGFELETDALEEKMLRLAETPYRVENVPIILSLVDTYICGIQGERQRVINFLESIVLQLAAFHSYDEVKLVFLLDENDLMYLDAVRYLPHTWDDLHSIRFVATNEAEAYCIGEYIKSQVGEETDHSFDLQGIIKKRPYYVIFAFNKKTFDGHEIFKEILAKDKNIGVSVITAFDYLVKESQKIITLNNFGKNICTTMSVDGGDDEFFAIDEISYMQKQQALHTISNISLKKITQAQAMPKMVTFLEMFDVGRIEQLNPLKRWRENNPVKSLAAPVGVGEDGTPFILDLHEKRQGPHGLVAGMTGSGKSEFLITYILSMAINYHPDEVSFVLIDYKGGGLASAFDNPRTGVRLPHLAGTITNLDGNSIQRSLMSIESELVRRQRVFNEAAKLTNEGTMNISTYQKLYRTGKVDKPMSHLFIISDEFAELKQQQPEFLEKLISAARIGRSLGVHLILATQKPGGVVNDQIRSNTKFQVCLRVQERSDSMDMIKRPDAAGLTDTGRFYLQVGYNEYFALGQSAWCGADYEPRDEVFVQRDDSIEFIDVTGQVIASKKPAIRKVNSGQKQLVAIVEYLSTLASNQGCKAKTLWEAELPSLLDSDKLQEKYSDKDNLMNICIGLVDDPQNQKQFPLNIDFENDGNMLIIGQAGSGKTTIIQNIIYSLSERLSPNDFNFYGLDYSSRLLKQFKPLPHCGAVLQEEDVGTLDEFFKLINKEFFRRKKLFSDLEVDNFAEARKKQQIPLIVVFIDNFVGLNATKMGENHVNSFSRYLKDSAVYGIKYIISCSNLRDVPSKIRQEIEINICLHMRDKYEYADALGCKVDYCSPDIPGRGLCRIDNSPLVIQSAMLCAEHTGAERIDVIKQKIQAICKSTNGQYVVQRMPVFDENAEYVDFAAQFSSGRIPLGYAKTSGKPVALPFKQFNTLALYFGNMKGTKPILNNFIYSCQRENMQLWIVKRKENSLFDINNPAGISVEDLVNADLLDCEKKDLRILQQALVGIIKLRTQQKESTENSLEANAQNIDDTKILLLIESIEDLASELNPVALLSFRTIFDKAQKNDIYVVGCFEPKKSEGSAEIDLLPQFTDGNIILFGGQYDKQKLYEFNNVDSAVEIRQYNTALMVYRKQIYPLVMPCGIVSQEKTDEDMESIF